MVCGNGNGYMSFAESNGLNGFAKIGRNAWTNFAEHRQTFRTFSSNFACHKKFSGSILSLAPSWATAIITLPYKSTLPVRSHTGEYWLIYRGPGILAVVWIWFGFYPTALSKLSLFLSLLTRHLSSLLTRRGGWGRSQKIPPRDSLVLYKSLNTLRATPMLQVQLLTHQNFSSTKWIKYFCCYHASHQWLNIIANCRKNKKKNFHHLFKAAPSPESCARCF